MTTLSKLIWRNMNFPRRMSPAISQGIDVLEPGIEYDLDSEFAILTDERRKSVKRIKVISFDGGWRSGIYIEPESLVRQSIAFSQFKKESADLLINLQKYYSLIGKQPGSNPLKAILTGYRGKFKIKFEDKEVYKFAALVAVHDS